MVNRLPFWSILALVLLTPGARAGAQTRIALSDVPVGASVILTSDSHDTWVAWSPDGGSLAFVSSQEGRAGLVLLNFGDVAVARSAREGIYAAAYLTDGSVQHPYRLLLAAADRTADSPVWLPNGGALLVRTYACADFATLSPQEMMAPDFRPCRDYRLDTVRVADGTTQPGRRVEVANYTRAPDGTLRIVREQSPTVVEALGASDDSLREVYRAAEPIRALTYDGARLMVALESMVVAVDEVSGQAHDVARLRTTGSTLQVDGETLYLTQSTEQGPAASTFHIGSRKARPLLGSYDYDPVLSPDRRWVAFMSEGVGGIVLQRLR